MCCDDCDLYNRNPHFNVVNGTIATCSCGLLNHLYNIKAFLYFAEYGILSIKVWRTSYSRIDLQLLIS